MTDTYVEHIWLDKIDQDDILPLQLAVGALHYGYKVEHILQDVAVNAKQLWRGQNDKGRFILVTQVVSHPGGKELNLWAFGGQGFFLGIEAAHKALVEYGKSQNCKWLTGMTKRLGFKRFYKRFPHQDVYRYLIGDLS